MIRSAKKIRTTLAQNDFAGLIVGLSGAFRRYRNHRKNLVRLTPRSQDHWQNSFVRDSAEGASDFQSRASTVDRSTIHSQMHRLSGYVRHDESLTPSPRGRGYVQNDFGRLTCRTFLAVPSAPEPPGISCLIDVQSDGNSQKSCAGAQKVVRIISGDKAKTQTYCDMAKLGEQIEQAHEKKDNKMVDELSQKLLALGEKLGPEYAALMDGLQDIDPVSQDVEEIESGIGGPRQAVYEVTTS
jgi:hypothetical protein